MSAAMPNVDFAVDVDVSSRLDRCYLVMNVQINGITSSILNDLGFIVIRFFVVVCDVLFSASNGPNVEHTVLSCEANPFVFSLFCYT